MMGKAVIFDMDGVIVDSEPIWAKAEYNVFSAYGVNVTEELAGITRVMTTEEVTKFWYSRFPWDNPDLLSVEQEVVAMVIELIRSEDCIMPGIQKFMERLRQKGYKIGLATNAPSRVITAVVEKAGIAHLFDHIASAEQEAEGKPHPAVYLTAAKGVNVLPENCIAVEDSNTGLLAAKRAGMKTVVYTRFMENINAELADYRIADFALPLPAVFDASF